VFWEQGERVCHRVRRAGPNGAKHEFVAALAAADGTSSDSANRLAREYELKDYLDSAWALQPIELVRVRGETMLIVEQPRGEPLSRLIGSPLEIGQFLRIAFFAIQFVSSLVEEGLLWFVRDASSWTWDIGRIRAKGYSDNVADLMVACAARLKPCSSSRDAFPSR
jgi:hypothetical protein